ncbi:MAG TPA: oxaloacetate decarboxylase, partial [Lacipirellulaceae bacterium]|nr:oxaloacetate decarboxylase [Lacipirellulaceae bacterium]
DLLKPEWDERRNQALALPGCNGADEDVLTFAMFPQVAPKFFEQRDSGPRNVSKAPGPTGAAGSVAGPAKVSAPAGGRVAYNVQFGGKSHQVVVEPA